MIWVKWLLSSITKPGLYLLEEKNKKQVKVDTKALLACNLCCPLHAVLRSSGIMDMRHSCIKERKKKSKFRSWKANVNILEQPYSLKCTLFCFAVLYAKSQCQVEKRKHFFVLD